MKNPRIRENKQVWAVGCSVKGETERDGVKVVVGMLGPKPEAMSPKELFRSNGALGCGYFRPVVNLDLYGQNKKTKVALDKAFQPKVVVTIYLTDYDWTQVKGGEPDIYFYEPKTQKWENLDAYAERKEISDIRRGKGAVSFRVLSWPLDDRYIACGG